MPRWFMSYAVRMDGCDGIGYGSCVIASAEHPVAKVVRWNREYHGRRTALLFYRKLDDGEEVPEPDVEITPW